MIIVTIQQYLCYSNHIYFAYPKEECINMLRKDYIHFKRNQPNNKILLEFIADVISDMRNGLEVKHITIKW